MTETKTGKKVEAIAIYFDDPEDGSRDYIEREIKNTAGGRLVNLGIGIVPVSEVKNWMKTFGFTNIEIERI
jgi:hypothetical protein